MASKSLHVLLAVRPPLFCCNSPWVDLTPPGSTRWRNITRWRILSVGKLFLARGSSQSFISCFPAAASPLPHLLSSMLSNWEMTTIYVFKTQFQPSRFGTSLSCFAQYLDKTTKMTQTRGIVCFVQYHTIWVARRWWLWTILKSYKNLHQLGWSYYCSAVMEEHRATQSALEGNVLMAW